MVQFDIILRFHEDDSKSLQCISTLLILGGTGIDILFSTTVDKWSPALQIRTVLLSIQALLSAPNPDDPLANDVADEWKTNESKAIETGM